MKNVYLTLILFLFASSLLAQQKDIDLSQSKNLKKGVKYMRSENYYHAIPYLEEALNENATDALTLFLLGKAYYQTHQEYKAYEYLDKAWQKRPNADPELAWYAARAYHFANRFEEALTAYQRALSNAETDSHKEHIKLSMKQCSTALEMKNQSFPPAKIENMGPFVNSKFSDYVPNFNAKMNQILFTSRRPRKPIQKHHGKFYFDDVFEDVYTAKYVNGIWHKVKIAEKNLPTKGHDANILTNKNFSEMYLFHSRKKFGDIYFSKKNGDKWSKPKPLKGEINTKFRETSFCLSPSGKYAFFASDRPDGKGGLDIYFCKKGENDTWVDARQVKFNSKYDEDAPYFDGKYLYFASNRPESVGGYDIFRVEMITETTFGEPENMGFPVNSGADDIYYSYNPDSNRAFFSSARFGGYGMLDNYIANFDVPAEESTDIFAENNNCDSLQQKVAELEEQVFELSKKMDKGSDEPTEVERLGSRMVLAGNIVDNVTDSPVKNAKVMLIDPKTNEIIQEVSVANATSRFSFDIHSGKKYRIVAEAPGHFKYVEDFSVPITEASDAHLKVIPLQKSNSLKSIVLGWQFFDFNSTKLVDSKIPELDHLALVLIANPEIRLKVVGHTDSDGTSAYNKELSQKRANSVASYLVSKGVEMSRIFTEAKGESEPLYDNTTKYKKWNRRVEIYIVR